MKWGMKNQGSAKRANQRVSEDLCLEVQSESKKANGICYPPTVLPTHCLEAPYAGVTLKGQKGFVCVTPCSGLSWHKHSASKPRRHWKRKEPEKTNPLS